METATKAKEVYVCLILSLLWCDVLNCITGFAWLFLGFSSYETTKMMFGGLALILVNLFSILFTCCGKYLSRGISSAYFWFRVFMFPG